MYIYIYIYIHTHFTLYIYIYIHIYYTCNKCSPAPDLVLRKLIFPGVFFFGVFFVSQTPVVATTHYLLLPTTYYLLPATYYLLPRCPSSPVRAAACTPVRVGRGSSPTHPKDRIRQKI